LKWIAVAIPVVVLLTLLVSVGFADTAHPFQPSYDLVSLTPSTPGGHGTVVQQTAAPLGDHAVGYLKYTLPAGWNIALVQSGQDEPIVGSGQLQIDVNCDVSVQTYPLTIIDDGKNPEDPSDVITNWAVLGYPFGQFTFTVRTSGSVLTIETYLFASGPNVCAPQNLDLTFLGVSLDNPDTTGDNEAGRNVLTQPSTPAVYTWSALFKSYPLTEPPEHTLTRCDQIGVGASATDPDVDGIAGSCDNCPTTYNPDERDFNLNGTGDACDPDADGDGVLNASDLCAFTPLGQSPDVNGCSQVQVDQDLDGKCDPGKSSPTLCTGTDNCPAAYNPGQADWNSNGIGDTCEDFDNDGSFDVQDNCRAVYNPFQEDINSNGVGDACDPGDFDADGFSDRVEYFAGTLLGLKCATIPTQNANPADINNDTFSDISDLVVVAGSFGLNVPPALARYNIAPDPVDTSVDITDIARIAGLFGQSCV
jgi:hypothetical protein